jgi:hypothetical protein
MISQKCPKCLSDRVRRGYRPTPIWSKILFRYNLLCDNCNWEFTGFAVPGTVSAKPSKRPKKNQPIKKTDNLSDLAFEEKVTNLPKETAETAPDLPKETTENPISLEKQSVNKTKARKKSQS